MAGQAHSGTSSWAAFGKTRTLFNTHPPTYPQSCSRRKLVRTRKSTRRTNTDNDSSSPPARRARYAHTSCYGNTQRFEQHPDFYSLLRSSPPPSVACAQRSLRLTLALSPTSTISCPKRSNWTSSRSPTASPSTATATHLCSGSTWMMRSFLT